MVKNWWLASRHAMRLRTKALSRPHLESLEERWCPKITTWTGAVSIGWLVDGNWDNGKPVDGDTVRLGA
jgi:hypothetical protein